MTVAVGVAVSPLPAMAAERSVSDVVLVDAGAVITDDLYAAGNRVVVQGRVSGDLIVFAYEDVTITGTVTGDVIGVAGSVVVTGTVGESVRVVSPRVEVAGEIGRDVVAVAWDTTLNGDLGGDAVIWGWRARTLGSIEGDLEGQTRSFDLGGAIAGNVDITVSDLAVRPGTVVGQDLGYRSRQPVTGTEHARVEGTVVHRRPLAPNVRVRALILMAKVVAALVAAIVGLLLMWAVPAASERAARAVAGGWWRAWLRGVMVWISPLVVGGLAVAVLALSPAQAAVPLMGVVLPLLLGVSGVVMALTLAAPAAVFPRLGGWGHPERGPVGAFLYGALVAGVAWMVPWLAWLVVLVVVPVGVGGWTASLASSEFIEPPRHPPDV